jgi:putative hemolysin
VTDIEILYLVFLFICLFLSAFFSGSETAFISLERFRVQHMVETKVKGARRIARMLERPDRFLSTILLGNNLVNTAAAALATILAVSVWGQEVGVIIATFGMAFILLIFAETMPKTQANRHAERVSLLLTRLVGGTPGPRSIVSDEEIRTMITVGHKEGTVEEAEADMLHAVFDFGDSPVSEVLVPRPEVVGIEKGETLVEFLETYSEFPISRFPVYEENMDNVVGVLSIKDVLMALAKGSITKEAPIDELIRPAYFTPETKRISELFTEMRDKNYRMAIVVDEYGGTAGIVSLSRLMEEIVGPVGDELAEAEKEYESINEYTFQVDGGMRIEETNEELGLELPEGDYETVAGFVLHLLGHIPKQGTQLKYRDLKIVITKMKGHKIEEILLTKEKKKKDVSATD